MIKIYALKIVQEEENLKTYKPKNIKFLLSLLFVNVLSVIILWYLLSSGNFHPINSLGQYEWINISMFILITTTIIGSFVTMVAYLIAVYIFKKEENIQTGVLSFKWGLIISLGLLLIFILNFFHILNIYWGSGILLIIIILSFII